MNDHEITALLERAGSGLRPEVAELVAGGAARGRTKLRRRRAGTAFAAVAVVGVVGAGLVATQLHQRPGDSTVTDPAGAPSGTVTPKPTAAGERDAPPAPDAALALGPDGIRDQLAAMLPGEVGPILREPPYSVVSGRYDRVLHFRYQGTLATFVIAPARSMASCQEQSGPDGSCTVVDGMETLVWGPTTADRVTAQGVAVWRHGYIVSVLSYNAAEGKDVAPLTAEPPLSLAMLTDIAMSDAWYS
ncbi:MULTISPECIES: hypothetical protein [unclassified Nocardioides]|uniref:hypothetical protein n=1 Tax=unclassified Nocardioides TaxID=2615069 RepID=UPI0009F12BBF|nr:MULTISPECIES: hypothetical protein [unclassified Nocardioides]GAW52023.1 uncharacterized protein PD653B2_4372 [Nocardioides sp. PD653-B2]GAW56371.1 uncharacterized protein PD653_3808 [Nocardioides sp. PD653]